MKSYRSREVKLRGHECVDQFMEGRLRLIQSRDGYRFSIDAILLAQFVTVRPGDVVVDLGTGCGVIPMILFLTKPVGRIVGLEIQEELADQALRNARMNGFEKKMDVIIGDIKTTPFAKKSVDVIVCNPPYQQVKSGRINPDPRRAVARHEILASLDDILRSGKDLLRKKGRLAMIYPSVRLTDVLVRMRRFNLEPKRLRLHYPDLESGAKLALIEAVSGGRPGLGISSPLLGQGDYSISAPP